jgi:hypothetical protein
VTHPCQFTPAILDEIGIVVDELRLPVHDPFAGTGERLGGLCDRIGVPFSGTEIEPEFVVDLRVDPGDSTLPLTYPPPPYMVVTSPVYPNGMTDHFEAKDASRRHTYRQALAAILGHDRPLHPNNMGRWGNRHRRSDRTEQVHFEIANRCIRWWPEWAVVNVKDVVATTYKVPVVVTWELMLEHHGYRIVQAIHVPCPGQRHGANRDLRCDHEVVLVARKEAP